ncbi:MULTISPECIES: two-component system response regulator NarL [Aeromonas]|uniref:two-component system response regulator NarL n=1 Tax=Aeromonas TaxID=642 RepID=UPI000F77C9EE|nr:MULTISPECIES: two-component system response regulator NarL [Aeromonas]RSM23352.1 two-component system response regulator NarL [Aeromonas salmonicida]RSM26064.1 two-component system response regulator NarL [Aeromonas salmonicida]WCH25761.1 two-component system response regulator NarL [Aeromonas salmonicida]
MEKQVLTTNADVSTILLIDDHPVLRNGIKQLLRANPFLTVVAEASTGQDGIQLALDYEPDLILLDLNMPEFSGLETLKSLRAHNVSSRIVIFTVSDYENDVAEAIVAGADGYLLKDMEPEDLIEAIEQACMGKLAISQKLTAVLIESLQSRRKTKHNDKNLQILSHREIDVLKLIAQGMPNKLISRRLFISEGTVKVHVKNILKKLKLHSRIEVAVWVHNEKISFD